MVAALFVFTFVFLIIGILLLAVFIIDSIFRMRIFEKAGRNKWLGFIPIYKDYIMIEIGEINWYWMIVIYGPVLLGVLVSFIPFVGSILSSALSILSIVGRVNVYYNVAKKFDTEDWFLIVLALVPMVGEGILAFSSKYEYHPEIETQPDGFCGDLGIIKDEGNYTNTNNNANQGNENVNNTTTYKNEEVKVTTEQIEEVHKEEVKEAKVEENEHKENHPPKKNKPHKPNNNNNKQNNNNKSNDNKKKED
jgi:hypothetical protein